MLLERLKEEQLSARKVKNNVASSVLTLLISEAEKIGKDDGNRIPTNDEIIRTAKKFINNINECLVILNNQQSRDNDTARLEMELAVVSKYIPVQLSEEQIGDAVDLIISSIAATSMKDMGRVMKDMKLQYGNTFDGGTASRVIKSRLST